MKQLDKRQLAGRVAVGISTFVTSIWAFWGIVENFHEGWYFESLVANLGLMITQYLGPMLIFMSVTMISIYWPRIGGGLHVFVALLATWFFSAFSNAATFLIIIPLFGIGALYWIGRIRRQRVAAIIAVGFPLLTLVIAGIEPGVRVSQRLDDGNLEERFLQGNGVALSWAPDGPGWPQEGGDWYDAQHACRYLREDGLSISSVPQEVWRLPSVDQSVRSMARHGENCEGAWDPEEQVATYNNTPDKESPLWNIHSPVIYWWTSTEVDEEHAYIVVYDGGVWSRSKEFGPAYLGFRCVK